MVTAFHRCYSIIRKKWFYFFFPIISKLCLEHFILQYILLMYTFSSRESKIQIAKIASSFKHSRLVAELTQNIVHSILCQMSFPLEFSFSIRRHTAGKKNTGTLIKCLRQAKFFY